MYYIFCYICNVDVVAMITTWTLYSIERGCKIVNNIDNITSYNFISKLCHDIISFFRFSYESCLQHILCAGLVRLILFILMSALNVFALLSMRCDCIWSATHEVPEYVHTGSQYDSSWRYANQLTGGNYQLWLN